MVTAIIADDEELSRQDLRRLLAALWPELRIVAECEDGVAALAAIERHAPDVAFLDIRMPGLSGLEVARALGGRCRAVFTTAYDDHALAAFDSGAIDYLLKPISRARLLQTVQRLRERGAAGAGAPDIDRLIAAMDLRRAAARIRWISASVGDTIKVFPIEKVVFFQSDDKYTRVVTGDDEAHVRTTIKELLEGLDPDAFWQIHRGAIVRADAIARVQRDEMGRAMIELRGRTERLKVSQSFAARFRPM